MFTPHKNLKALNVNDLLKYFNKLFDELALRHSDYNVFDNFLDCCINGLCLNYDRALMNRIVETYNQDERYMFGEMLQIWIRCMDIKVSDDHSFYDFFGNIYETNAMTKTKGFAQYFTPEPIAKFMAQILLNNNSERESINEPACGSGRMNLAAHNVNHKLFHVANDLDITCAKMAALNFVIHGIKGIVICDDGLFPGNQFKCAFIINYYTAPFIEHVTDNSKAYRFINANLSKNLPVQNEVVSTTTTNAKTTNPKSGGQLSLFD